MNILWYTFFKGLVFGFTMAAIPGPIFFLIIQRTLAEGTLTGLLCGLGAVTADTVYALIAAVGLTLIMHLLITYQASLALVGGLFLIYLGFTTLFKKLSTQTIAVQDKRLFSAWFLTFLLTLTNPVTILSYCVIFAGIGIDPQYHTTGATISLTSGVAIGAMLLVILLVGFLSFFRQKFSQETVVVINKLAGIVLIGFGIAALFRGIIGC